MIKIPIDIVYFIQPTAAGKPGEFGKSLQADGKLKLTYLGHGVLVEYPGKKDDLIPIAHCLKVSSNESVTAEQWGGAEPYIPPAPPSRLTRDDIEELQAVAAGRKKPVAKPKGA